MTSKPIVAGVCAAAIALTAGSSVFAQAAAPAAPAAQAVTHGPPLTGVCIFSFETAIQTSTVGHSVDTRMQQIVAQVNAELTAEKTAIDNDAKGLDARRATLDQATLESQASQLQIRANALQRKAQLRDREVSATEQKAVARISQELEPFIRQSYQSKACSILLQRSAVIIGNPAMDITPAVVAGLNGKITQFAFERERLDQPGAPAAGGAPAIVQTPGPARTPAAPAKR
ncbi:MAG TPA: OmpH family outer membrane protein [Phenylobacterium sp.]|jgi:Skp family chaperone for outer membrane proteins|uniref:OmpH family outer membrane protein n=1 Tax=Phenylobacterium sp. TaxID=1871053 RepID=UPI002BDFB50A|nr:OmpH family outer membrane protein [Phenylobacterium sp.]HXA38569.1 OmpH family outer membrane protein [Phenylobacterium sp.]